MTLPTDKEQYICLDCYAVGELTASLRCSTCDSDAVASVEAVHAARVKWPLNAAPSGLPVVERVWYHICYGTFETVVPYTKANNLEEALKYSEGPLCEWYWCGPLTTIQFEPTVELQTKLLDHKGFNEWCRKRWPLQA